MRFKCGSCGQVREMSFASEMERDQFGNGFRGWCEDCKEARDFNPA